MDTVETIEQDRETAVNALYTIHDGARVPLHADHVHQARLAEAERVYNERLAALQAEAEADRAAAEELASMQYTDKTTWLTAEELAAANGRASFVREDLAAADVDTQLNMARRALASGDKPLAWLMLRYLPQTAAAAAESVSLAAELGQVVKQLETAVMPEAQRRARQEAKDKILAAENKRVAVKHARWVANGRKGVFNPFK